MEEKVGITLSSRVGLKRVFRKLFRANIPFEIVGYNSIIVTTLVRESLRSAGFKFTDLEIVKMSNLSKSEMKKIAKKRERQKERKLKLFVERYGRE